MKHGIIKYTLLGAIVIAVIVLSSMYETRQETRLIEKLEHINDCHIHSKARNNGTMVYYCTDTQMRVYEN